MGPQFQSGHTASRKNRERCAR